MDPSIPTYPSKARVREQVLRDSPVATTQVEDDAVDRSVEEKLNVGARLRALGLSPGRRDRRVDRIDGGFRAPTLERLLVGVAPDSIPEHESSIRDVG